MKIGTASVAGAERLVVGTSEDTVVLLQEIWPEGPADMFAAMDEEPEISRRVAAAAATAKAYPVGGLHWLPPVPRPGKVICVALNNSANKDRIIKGPTHPTIFIKPVTSLLGHGQPIRLRKDYGRVHPEPELVVVIGRGGSEIAATEAYCHVFGYTIINDLTSPTMRGEDTFHYRAIHPRPDDPSQIQYVDTWVSYPGRYKGSDGFGPIGPWIATRSEIPDPHALKVRCVHRGRLITEDSTVNLSYKVPEVIEFVSRYMSLERGDVIAMGTALQRAGGGQAVQTLNLNELGGPIDVSISGIGTLSNPVEWR